MNSTTFGYLLALGILTVAVGYYFYLGWKIQRLKARCKD